MPNHHSISDWHSFLDKGRCYMATARKGLNRPAVFNNELILQLTAMAMENFLVSIWQYHGRMPADHTLSGLVDGMINFFPMDLHLIDGIKQVEGFDDICALMPSFRRSPTDLDISSILQKGEYLADFVSSRLQPI